MKKYLSLLVFFSFNVSAKGLCQRVAQGIIPYLQTAESRISFKNQGGLFNGGVCWWHSRLQRSSAYLAEFKPELAPPTLQEAQIIIRQLKVMTKTVTIPGFADFAAFSKAYQAEVQNVLEVWQREDGFLNSEWIRGISGQYELAPEIMKIRMDKLHEQFLKSPHPIWIMAQIQGVESHAFLILSIDPIENGYELEVIDSNVPTQRKSITYQVGQRFLKHPKDKYSFVPYLGFQKDFQFLQASVVKKCGNVFGLDSQDISLGEVELKQGR
jgi:hypothetical protein